MMVFVFASFLVSFNWPNEDWALFVLATGSGLGFVRPCVALHTQAVSGGNVEKLSLGNKYCGAARSCADVCAYVLPAAIYDESGWAGVTLFAAVLSVLYFLVALPSYMGEVRLSFRSFVGASPGRRGAEEGRDESELAELAQQESCPEQNIGLQWIDWVLSAAFVSTELLWNILNTAVPVTLVHGYGYRSSVVGAILGSGSLVCFFYLMAIPSLPKMFNLPRPFNIIFAYSGMTLAWLLMLASVLREGHGSLVPFICGAWIFLCMGSATQVSIIECLTGVCDAANSAKIMGLSEMIGCAFGMAGSYVGTVPGPGPFAMCSTVCVLGIAMLSSALQRRRAQTITMPQEPMSPASPPGEQESGRPRAWSSQTYIETEVSFRSDTAQNSSGHGLKVPSSDGQPLIHGSYSGQPLLHGSCSDNFTE
ncbi:unnamed protein product [Polarella glacialis]|nr:unnamed protein product [Polarella glacialis]